MTVPFALIIEDDEKLAEIVSLTLQTAQYVTETVTNGAAALIRLAEVIPDLVILDLHLPQVGGPEILRHIRADQRLAKTKVILTTADDRLAETLEYQADLVLLKPVSPQQLGALADRLRPALSQDESIDLL